MRAVLLAAVAAACLAAAGAKPQPAPIQTFSLADVEVRAGVVVASLHAEAAAAVVSHMCSVQPTLPPTPVVAGTPSCLHARSPTQCSWRRPASLAPILSRTPSTCWLLSPTTCCTTFGGHFDGQMHVKCGMPICACPALSCLVAARLGGQPWPAVCWIPGMQPVPSLPGNVSKSFHPLRQCLPALFAAPLREPWPAVWLEPWHAAKSLIAWQREQVIPPTAPMFAGIVCSSTAGLDAPGESYGGWEWSDSEVGHEHLAMGIGHGHVQGAQGLSFVGALLSGESEMHRVHAGSLLPGRC